MPDQTPPPRPGPPPLPPAQSAQAAQAAQPSQPFLRPLQYQGPMPPPGLGADPGGAQRVFDAVVGPNLRLRDNLIQLACVIVGAALGGGVGWWFGSEHGDATIYVLGGTLIGLVAALVISGLVIGIVRGAGAMRRR